VCVATPGPTTKGGFADHQVEAAPGDRGGHVAGEQLDVHFGQCRGGGGEAQRPVGQVGRGHRPGMRGQVQGLDSAAGTQIQRAVPGPT